MQHPHSPTGLTRLKLSADLYRQQNLITWLLLSKRQNIHQRRLKVTPCIVV